jgi:catechol 2,3-dioxygenase-like lactoylglutathione lyase family enzyme
MSRLKTLPLRLHHYAYTTDDHEENRRFYEDVLGLPLKVMWIEQEQIDGENVDLGHAFYGLGDGSFLAFFNFSDPEKQRAWKAKEQSLFVHISLLVEPSTQKEIESRLLAAGLKPFMMEHGFCHSLYIKDPNGLILEFTVDHQDSESIYDELASTASRDLERWMSGDRNTNNRWRSS